MYEILSSLLAMCDGLLISSPEETLRSIFPAFRYHWLDDDFTPETVRLSLDLSLSFKNEWWCQSYQRNGGRTLGSRREL